MLHNIKEIAKIAGVSPSTVSRVFNNRPYVKEEIRKRIIEISKKLNYSPKLTSRRKNILILIESLEKINIGEYENMVLTTIAKHILRKKFTFEIISIDEIDITFKNFYDAIIGIIYTSESIEKIKGIKNVPFITINNPLKNFYNVYSDHYQGIEIAIDYLYSKGHRRIGLFRRWNRSWGDAERLKGYEETLKKYNIEIEKGLIQDSENQNIFEAIAKICKNGATCLICCGEDAISEVCYSLYLLNKKIPDDISVISFENIALSKYLTPPHTTINQNLEIVAEKTIENVEKILNGEKGEMEIVIKNTIIERESVKRMK